MPTDTAAPAVDGCVLSTNAEAVAFARLLFAGGHAPVAHVLDVVNLAKVVHRTAALDRVLSRIASSPQARREPSQGEAVPSTWPLLPQ